MSNHLPQKPKNRRLFWFGGIFLVLLLAFSLSPLSTHTILSWGAALAQHPLAVLAILIAMALLMSFGLPGSIGFWLIAPFHAPLLATLLLTLGTTAGAIGAYIVGSRLTDTVPSTRIGQRIHELLTQRGDLLTQISLRMLPGFPHALVNLTGGILRLPLATFIAAALIGLTIKWAVYSNAVYGATSALQAETALGIHTLLPLAILGVMVMISGQLKRSSENRRRD